MRYVVILLSMLAIFAMSALAVDRPQVIKISAKRFSFTPSEITLKKGVPVVLELTTLDRSHGISIPKLKVRASIEPGKPTDLKITPTETGEFEFYCDVFCGFGHDGMTGKIKVID